ncbi:unnamed protein product [Victoria cruziana]
MYLRSISEDTYLLTGLLLNFLVARDQAQLIKKIVNTVVDKVRPRDLYVGECFIGHDIHVEKLMSSLSSNSDDCVRIIGIHGIGGIGKTTLAKTVYNKIYREFEASSFISGVGEVSSSSKGLESLQQQLLKDVLGSDVEYHITDTGKGTQLIKQKFGQKKVLVLLDDVDHIYQLRALIGNRSWFRKGNRIIITARDKKPLIIHGLREHEIYELGQLNFHDSFDLFHYHAFKNGKTQTEEYMKLCDEAVSYIQGLPLALEVLGSQFNVLDTPKQWNDFLALLKESQQKDIFEKLKLSYDSLSCLEQQVFLDTACFFIDRRREAYRLYHFRGHMVDEWDMDREGRWEVNDVKFFWNACGFYPELAIENLKHKALLKISPDGKWFEMHDQIRDMARKIVQDDDQKCNRLWNFPKVERALQGKIRVPTDTHGIMLLQVGKQGTPFNAPQIQDMDKMRLFHIDGGKFNGFPHVTEDVKWLGFPNCQFQMPTSVSIPEGISILDLSKNDYMANVLLENCRSRSVEFNKLKILDLGFTCITRTPDFSNIPCLVKLTLTWCRELIEIHGSVGQLKSLAWLNLTGCWKLEKLPSDICRLTSLEFLSLRDCRNLLSLPEQLGDMASLKYLDLDDAHNIRSLPVSMRKLQSLEHLIIRKSCGIISTYSFDLAYKRWLETSSSNLIDALPDQCCKTKTRLTLIDPIIEKLVNFFARWENLESMILSCRSLKTLPAGVEQLQKLKVLKVHSNKLILFDNNLPLYSVENMVLKCVSLKHVSSLYGKGENLKHLTLECKYMEVLPDWIRNLETLVLRGCENNGFNGKIQPPGCFDTLKISVMLDKLKILKLEGCSLTMTPNFSYFPSLEKLKLKNCNKLIEVHESIGILSKLELLKIKTCTMLERLPESICELGSLKALDLKGCAKLSSLPGKLMHDVKQLRKLCLDETGIIITPALIAKLTNPDKLSIKNCPFQKVNTNGDDFFELNGGNLHASTSWEIMDALSRSCCESIHELCFTNKRIEKLADSIGRFKNVEKFILTCDALKALPHSIGKLESLKDFKIQCHTLTLEMSMLEKINKLSVECIDLKSPSFTSGSSGSCSKVNIKQVTPPMEQLWSFSKVRNKQVMNNLRTLELCARQAAVTLDFSFMPRLDELTLRDCEVLTEVHDSIGTLKNLRTLKITGCNALEGLPDTICHLSSLEKMEITQFFHLPSSSEDSSVLELLDNLGVRGTQVRRIFTSLRQLPNLRELNLQKSCPGRTRYTGTTLARNGSLEICGSYLELAAALPYDILRRVTELAIKNDLIEVLPDYIADMKNLKQLKLECPVLQALPSSIRELKLLSSFEVNCEKLTFLDEICSLKSVSELKIRCLHSQPVPSSFWNLKLRHLEFKCSSLETLPDRTGSVVGPSKLSLSGCKNMKQLPDLVGQIEGLESLDLSKTGIVELPSRFDCFTKLRELDLSNTQNLVLYGLSDRLTSLETFVARECHWAEDALENVLGTRQSSTLRNLDLSGSNFRHLPACIGSFSALYRLNVSGCKQLHSIPPLSCPNLMELNATDCSGLRELPMYFSSLPSISNLFLGGCSSLQCIPGFETIAGNIKRLELPGPNGTTQCSNLTDDFRNTVFMGAVFQYLERLSISGNLSPRSHRDKQRLSFLFPHVTYGCELVELTLHGISSSVHITVMEDDYTLFETAIPVDDEEGSKTFSFKKGDEIFKHFKDGPLTILVSMDMSKLFKIKLQAEFGNYGGTNYSGSGYGS